jgi:hypothetical protein
MCESPLVVSRFEWRYEFSSHRQLKLGGLVVVPRAWRGHLASRTVSQHVTVPRTGHG